MLATQQKEMAAGTPRETELSAVYVYLIMVLLSSGRDDDDG